MFLRDGVHACKAVYRSALRLQLDVGLTIEDVPQVCS